MYCRQWGFYRGTVFCWLQITHPNSSVGFGLQQFLETSPGYSGLCSNIKLPFVFYFHLPEMALITISGFPCSGKSQRAHELSQYMAGKIQDLGLEGIFRSVQIISDDVLGLQRSVYDGIWCVSSLTFCSYMNCRKLLWKASQRNPIHCCAEGSCPWQDCHSGLS